MTESESADQIDEAAFAWVARLDRHGSTTALETELSEWLAADSRRRGAFLRAQAIWGKLDRASQADAGDAPPRAPIGVTRRAAFAGGGGLMAAGLAGAWLLLREEPVATTLGEVRHEPLADGSRMILNTDTKVGVAFRREERRIRLASGEAWFHVAKDRDRPFVVEAGPVRVRAVGTAFSVRRQDDGADVFVTEGVVEAWVVGAEAVKTRVSAGETAHVRDRERQVAVAAASGDEIDRKLAWRAGKIDLDGETLADAIAQFNRFNRRKLVLKDPGLAGRRFYGVFRADDPEGFARSAGVTLRADISYAPDEIAIGG